MWKDLTIEEKGKVMREAMKKKNYNLAKIAQEYDDGLARRNVAPSYANGGHLHQETNSNIDTIPELEPIKYQPSDYEWKYNPQGGLARINPDTQGIEGFLPPVNVVDNAAYPKRGSRNYDSFVSNTYDAWQRGDITTSDINRMPMDIRNNVLGERNKMATSQGISDAALPVLAGTVGVPAAVIGGIQIAPYISPVTEFIGTPFHSSLQLINRASPRIAQKIAQKVIRPNQAKMLDTAYNTILSGFGVRDVLSDNGIQKTIKLISDRDYLNAAKSGAIDALNIIGGTHLVKGLEQPLYNFTKQYKWRNAIWDNYKNMANLADGNPYYLSRMDVDAGGTYLNGLNKETRKPRISLFGDFSKDELAHYNPFENKIHVKPSTYYDPDNRFMHTIGHETWHGAQRNLTKDRALTMDAGLEEAVSNIDNDFLFIPDRKSGKSIADILDKQRGNWEGSLDEIDSNVVGLLGFYKKKFDLDNVPRFKDLDYEGKQWIYDYIKEWHNLNDDEVEQILETLSNRGYF